MTWSVNFFNTKFLLLRFTFLMINVNVNVSHFFNLTPKSHSPTYHTILESGWFHEQIKIIPDWIRTCNSEILDSQVLITEIVFSNFFFFFFFFHLKFFFFFYLIFLWLIFLYDNNFYDLDINLGITSLIATW